MIPIKIPPINASELCLDNCTLFKQMNSIMTQPIILYPLIFIAVAFLSLMLIIGLLVRGKTKSGQKMKTRLIERPNFWWFLIPYLGIIVAGFIMMVFPYWLALFE